MAALAHDQSHVQSQLQVSCVPVPACVVIVVVFPQNVNVHVQFQGSLEAASDEEPFASAPGGGLGSPVGGELSPAERGAVSGGSVSEQPHFQSHSHAHVRDAGSPESEEEDVEFPVQSTVSIHTQVQGSSAISVDD